MDGSGGRLCSGLGVALVGTGGAVERELLHQLPMEACQALHEGDVAILVWAQLSPGMLGKLQAAQVGRHWSG